MTSFLELTYSCVYSLCRYITGRWPLSLIYGKPLKAPSPETEEKIYEIFDLLKSSLHTHVLQNIQRLVESLPDDEDLFSVVDPVDGFDILQHAVIRSQKSVLQVLLQKNCSLNRYQCSPPLHLAANLGCKGIVELLLQSGADPSYVAGMCFPDFHKPIELQNLLFGLVQREVYYCQKKKLSAIQCAIQDNHVECLVHILNFCKEKPKFVIASPVEFLHFACAQGAASCIQYFLQQHPEYINVYNSVGDTPLLTAVPWGRECVKLLVDGGADVHLASKKIRETALHRLYRMNIDGLFSIYDCTMYLLTTGIEQDINAFTTLGETPLHMLVSHVSYTGGNYVNVSERKVPRSDLQKDYQQQILNTLRTLLQYNADVTLLNAYGLTPLSRMLHIAVKACNGENAYHSCVASSIFSYLIKDYKNDYSYLAQAMEILLQYRPDQENANFQCESGHSPLLLLLQCLLYDDVSELISQENGVLNAFDVLLRHGACLNFVAGNKGTCATLIAMVCQRVFKLEEPSGEQTEAETASQQSLKVKFASLANGVLRLLLKYGLDANHKSSRTCQYPKGGSGNALIEFVRLTVFAKSFTEFQIIHTWLKTLLQWGADPNLEPYPSEPIICHSQSSIFLKKQGTQAINHYIHEVKEHESMFLDGRAQDLLLLFYNTMDHRILYECLGAAKTLVRYPPPVLNGQDFLGLINLLSEHPRSLKQIARVAIYKALGRQIAARVDELPLPRLLRNYILDIL